MAKIGGHNPIPTKIGGSPSRTESIYRSLRDMMGVNGKGEPGSLEDEWRVSKARALACIEAFDERAAKQFIPSLVTDLIPTYENILGISPSSLSDEDRRQEIIPRWFGIPDASFGGIEDALEEIDPRMSLIDFPWGKAATTVVGQWYDDGVNPWGLSDGATAFPAYSDKRRVRIFYDIGNGVTPTAENVRRMSSRSTKSFR